MLLFGACSFSPAALSTELDASALDRGSPVITWSVDSVSGIAVPDTQVQWAELLDAANIHTGAPAHVWLLQETSGNLADSIGSAALAPVDQPSWAVSVPGWSRAAVATNETPANDGFYTNSTGNLDGTSYAFLVFLVANQPTQSSSLFGLGQNGDHRFAGVTTAPAFAANGIGVTTSSGSLSPGTSVHPVLLEINNPLHRYVVYTDHERIDGMWKPTTGAGGLAIIGNVTANATAARYLYAALWVGSAAELDDLTVKAMLTTMGWSVTGY
jgi:hypothetical protein